MTFNALRQHVKYKMGIASFITIKIVMIKGEKVDIKQRTQFGSNELMEAMFPVPKSEIRRYNNWKFRFFFY